MCVQRGEDAVEIEQLQKADDQRARESAETEEKGEEEDAEGEKEEQK